MDKLKEILFGFIVIAALGVIFVPMLFKDEKNSKEGIITPPPKPEHTLAEAASKQKTLAELKENKRPVPEPIVAKQPIQDEPELAAQATPPSMMATATPAAQLPPAISEAPSKKPTEIKELPPASETPVEPTMKEQGAIIKPQAHEPSASGWVVQVGTFAMHENAVKLAKILKREGYPAYSKNRYRSGRNLTLVLVGPNSDQNAACQVRDVIENQYGLRGEVIHFVPSKYNLEEDNQ